MRVFVTGATGFIGMAVTKELIAAGHQVLGLYRDEAKASALSAAGAEPYAGTLENLDSLRNGAAQSEAVIHLAFNHDFSKFAENSELDRRAIAALGSALKGSNKPLLVTGGVGLLAPGRVATEDDPPPSNFARASEAAAAALASEGVNASVVRLPQVHDPLRQGLITYAVQMCREKGVCFYVGDGQNAWSAAHVLDVARLYRLAIEKAETGARYHAVAEEGVAMRAIAETISKRLNLPVKSITPDEAPAHFGWLAMFAGLDMCASSAKTQEALGWTPTGPSLLEDLRRLPVDDVQTAH
jgi:nucleoside-diphosphate-sugar epimerase